MSLRIPGGRFGIAALGAVGLVGAAGATLGVRGLAACRSSPTRDAHAAIELHVPRVGAPIPIDGEVEGKKAWESDVGGTGVFKTAAGQGMVPYSEARLRWRDGTLYLWLYAGDLDLEGSVTERDGPVLRDDAFRVELGAGGRAYTIDVNVLGTIADTVCARAVGAPDGAPCDASWQSGATVGVDRDGTLNRTGDNDEEWIVEMAVPLASLGLGGARAGTRIPFAVRRCDVQKSGAGACGGFGLGERAEIVLDATPLESAIAQSQ